jgi:hypothetical protein
MCLQTTWKKPKEATEDITVYKIVRRDSLTMQWRPPFYYEDDFVYKIGELHKTTLEETSDISHLDCEALSDRQLSSEEWISIGQGFHSAATEGRLIGILTRDHYIAECIIPKGSLYYKGFSDLLVSNQIKILRILNWD